MIFNTSSEQHAIVGLAASAARRKVSMAVAEAVKNISLECGAGTWSFISILIPDDLVEDYPEIRRYHKKDNAIEVRVQLPFFEFKEADAHLQLAIMIDGVYRSIDMMGGINSLKLTDNDARVLKEAVAKARVQLGSAES